MFVEVRQCFKADRVGICKERFLVNYLRPKIIVNFSQVGDSQAFASPRYPRRPLGLNGVHAAVSSTKACQQVSEIEKQNGCSLARETDNFGVQDWRLADGSAITLSLGVLLFWSKLSSGLAQAKALQT